MALVKVRVRPTHNYGHNPAGTVLDVELEELRRLPDVLEIVKPAIPAAVPIDPPDPVDDAEEKEHIEEQLASEELDDPEAASDAGEGAPATEEDGSAPKRRRKRGT